MNTMNTVPNLSQKPLLLRAMAAPSGMPISRESAMDMTPSLMEIGAFLAISSEIGAPTL